MSVTDNLQRIIACGQRPYSSVRVLLKVLLLCGMAIGAGLLCVVLGNLAIQKPALLAVLPVVLLTGFLFLYSPKALLVVILLVRAGANPLFEQTKLPGIGGLGGLLNAMVILISAIIILRDPQKMPRVAWLAWLPFMMVAGAGIFHSPEPLQAVRIYLGLMSVVALFMVAFSIVQTKGDLDRVLSIVSWSTAPVVLLTLLYIFQGKTAGSVDALEGDLSRYAGPFEHPNILAFYLVLAIVALFYRWKAGWVGQTVLRSVVVLSYIVVMVALIFATKTRSAWMALLMIFVTYGIFCERRYLLYLLVLGALAMLNPDVHTRVMGLSQGNEVVQYAKLNSFAWRKLLWADALGWMHPGRYIFGYGSESFFYLSPQFFSMAGGNNWGAHSWIVQIFFELGALGVLCFAWIFRSVGKGVWWLGEIDIRLFLLVLSLLLGYLMVSASDNVMNYLVYNWYFWWVMGAACSLAIASRNRSSDRVALH